MWVSWVEYCKALNRDPKMYPVGKVPKCIKARRGAVVAFWLPESQYDREVLSTELSLVSEWERFDYGWWSIGVADNIDQDS